MGNLQRRFVSLPCVVWLSGGTERISQFRMQRASQSLNSIAEGQVFGDTDCIAKLHDCQVGLTAQVRTSGKPPENYGPAVALRLIQSSENALEDIGRLAYLTFLQQSLATLAVSDIPLVRALRATRILFSALLSH